MAQERLQTGTNRKNELDRLKLSEEIRDHGRIEVSELLIKSLGGDR